MKPDEDPDVQLMLAVQRDDRAAFEALFRKYVRQVTGFALSIVGSRMRAEELVQEAFLQIYRARRRYQPRARFATWLYRVVANLCVSESRRPEHRVIQRPLPQTEGSAEESSTAMVADAGGRSSEDNVLAQEDLHRMRVALLQLPPQQRAALWLARVEGLSYAEVARSLGCSVSAVKSLIHRATASLRERWGEGA